jgi:hypothetical protein
MTLAGLPRMAPEEATWRMDIMSALNGQESDGMFTRAAIVAAPLPDLAWFRCVDRGAFAFGLCAGQRPLLMPDDTDTAVALLDACEPILRLIEYALGIELEPDRLVDTLDFRCALIRVDVAKGEQRVHSLYLALPWLSPIRPRHTPFAPELLARVSVPTHLSIIGPRVAPHDAADLSVGDMLLLGAAPLRATLYALGGPRKQGRFDAALHHFTSHEETGNE